MKKGSISLGKVTISSIGKQFRKAFISLSAKTFDGKSGENIEMEDLILQYCHHKWQFIK